MKALTHGVGYLGVGEHKAKVAGKMTKKYNTWHNMLRRCYSEKYHSLKPTYKDCLVDERWYNFQTFAKWYEENYVEGYTLDKDILIKGNKVYSPETCCFVPIEINTLFVKGGKIRGLYPIGVRVIGDKFQSRLSISGKHTHLGTFSTPEEAFESYKVAKEHQIKKLAIEYYSLGKIPLKLYKTMYNYKVEIND